MLTVLRADHLNPVGEKLGILGLLYYGTLLAAKLGLAHSICVDKNMSLGALEESAFERAIKANVHRAFWDLLQRVRSGLSAFLSRRICRT